MKNVYGDFCMGNIDASVTVESLRIPFSASEPIKPGQRHSLVYKLKRMISSFYGYGIDKIDDLHDEQLAAHIRKLNSARGGQTEIDEYVFRVIQDAYNREKINNKGFYFWWGEQGQNILTLKAWLRELGYNITDLGPSYTQELYDAINAFYENERLASKDPRAALRVKGLANRFFYDYVEMIIEEKRAREAKERLAKEEAIKQAESQVQAVSAPQIKLVNTTTMVEQKPVDHSLFVKTLKFGDEGEQVKLVQTRLNELAFYNDKIDGVYGFATLMGVKSFQKSEGLIPNGHIDEVTWNKLFFKHLEVVEPEIVEAIAPKKPMNKVVLGGAAALAALYFMGKE